MFSLIIAFILRKYRLLAITGTIGSGKSTLVKLLRKQFPELLIIDCDEVTHTLFDSLKFQQKLKEILNGNPILNSSGELDRRAIGKVIFDPANSDLKTKYLRFINFAIFKKLLKLIMSGLILNGEDLIVLEAPTLFESRFLAPFCFEIITVYLDDEEEALRRVLKREADMSAEEIKNRIRHQFPIQKKISMSDVSIANNGPPETMLTKFLAEIDVK